MPAPHLEFKEVLISLENSPVKLNSKNLKIFPGVLNIYNYKNFVTNKLILENGNSIIQSSEFKSLTKFFFNQKQKLSFENFNLKINKKDKQIIVFKNIQFSNFGYNRNLVRGNVFGKKFIVKINNNLNEISFKLLKSGVSADIKLITNQNTQTLNGIFKSKILNTNLKLNFEYDYKTLKIYNSFFRSKNLSFSNKSSIIFEPFLDIKSHYEIDEINKEIFKIFNIEQVLQLKNFIRKINMESNINLKSKKFSRDLINNLKIKTNFAYGRMNYVKEFSISDNNFKCEGDINLLEEYPLLFFNCSIEAKDKRKFLREFSIKIKNENENLKLNIKGNLSLLNKKINFKEIIMNQTYNASKEDLEYFKLNFEKIFFDKSLIEMFDKKKIKEFILEIS